MENIEKQNQDIARYAKGLERKCEMLESCNERLELDNNNLKGKYNMVVTELQKQLRACYTTFELAVKVVTDDVEKTLKSDYYKDWNITTWLEMQDACDSKDTKANIRYTLTEYAKKFGIWELFPDDDGAIRTKDGDLITYRQLTNEVRKELKRRGLLNG